MAEKDVLPTYARSCVAGPAGTPGGWREVVSIMNDDGSMRPIADILGDLNEMIWDEFPHELVSGAWETPEDLARIKRRSLPGMEGGFHAWPGMDPADGKRLWPKTWQWIAVYPVTGTSEGHYVHISLMKRNGNVTHIAMLKTFSGWQRASMMAEAAGKLLGA